MKKFVMTMLAAAVAQTVAAEPIFFGAKRHGARPGSEIIWRVPTAGAESVEAATLPDGLTFDAERRTIRGRLPAPGEYEVVLRARGGNAEVEERLTVVVGEEICLAPPMGWNSWYSFSEAVNQAGMERVAELLETSGLADAGWTYVNIDDCWQGERPAGNALQPNEKFPDMRAFCDAVHARGLKAGIYSTPWISTYAGFRGSSSDDAEPAAIPPAERLQPGQLYGRWPGLERRGVARMGKNWHFDVDARQWAEWGFDYVKVDWKPNDVPSTRRIAADLRACGRDVVLSLSNAAPFADAPALSRLANLWRTTGDIQDTWQSVRAIARAQLRWLPFRSEGHWNDPDILQIGRIGTPNRPNLAFRPTRLTPAEQRYQMTLWCMLSAPLLISCDLAALDEETKALLTDPALIALDQRHASAPLTLVAETPDWFILRKDLPDGPVYGLFNDSDAPRTIALPDGRSREVPPHAALLVD